MPVMSRPAMRACTVSPFAVPKGAFIQPFWSVSAVNDCVSVVNELDDNANETPFSEVKQVALEFAPSEIT